ncbi:MAG: class I SAM-dependent DNA methyltransferase [Thermoanaerobaculia bacterium]
MAKQYDRDYFDRWYRDPRSRVTESAELRRRAAAAVAAAEIVLGRELESVLDVGCGEGRWLVPLRAMRPDVDYVGLDPSDYAVERYGRTRHIRKGSFGDLDALRGKAFDLVVCADVLHYLEPREIDRGLEVLPSLVAGVALLDVTTREDAPEGDLDGWISRPARWYADRFREAGLVPCGLMCWMPRAAVDRLTSIERAVVEGTPD